jgi:hypothetical protein
VTYLLVMLGSLGGAVALVAVLCALSASWHATDPQLLGLIALGDESLTPLAAERAVTDDLLAGMITGTEYREVAGALAAREPQLAALLKLTS